MVTERPRWVTSPGTGVPFEWWIGLILLSLTGCCTKDKVHDPEPLPALSVEVVPHEVYAEEGHSFLLEARVRNAEGLNLRKNGFEPRWETNRPDEIQLDGLDGGEVRVTVKMLSGAGAGGVVGEVYATVDGIRNSVPAVVRALPNMSTAPSQDYLLLPSTDGEIPAAALIDACPSGGSDCPRRLFAISKRAQFEENFKGPPAPRGFYFFPHRSFSVVTPTLSPTVWTSAQGDQFPGPPYTPSPEKKKVELRFWEGLEGSLSETIDGIKRAFEIAQWGLADSRAGIELVWGGIEELPYVSGAAPGRVLQNVTNGDYCHDLANTEALFPAGANLSKKIHVVVAESFGVEDGKTIKGLFCDFFLQRDASNNPLADFAVLFINDTLSQSTTLSHEIGHALGLNGDGLEGRGHAQSYYGMDCSNIMTESLKGWCPAGRQWYTLGQVFRMNVDPASWLKTMGLQNPSVICGQDGTGENPPSSSLFRCPHINLDFADPSPWRDGQ